ncbi:Beta-barrel assembly-enhancing protease [Methylobacterium crusticola]|uniref:Beta-barrel assembly-enhancing protease n=1 Tax=Methylobacterium crusticola TaxID=1697972 RepID=A0ABQ4R4S4_9HYPH|nr:tetratricopeptide repeat protein [Methylobacterium crusticola]GJD52648.1 Beta-barrel assembly-enhancing protease [Methylobacterium crusticola]
MRVRYLLSLCVSIAGASGYLLFPTAEEQLAMLARDGRTSEASGRLTELLALAQRDPALMAAAARVHERSGRFKRAAELLELYVGERPADTRALDWLASLYEAGKDPAGATHALARAFAIAPTRARLSALLDLYRLQERADEERALLKTVTDPDLLRPVDVERFGVLLSWAGEQEAALATLRRADALLPAESEVGRFVLFDILMALGLHDEAAGRADGWVEGWRGKPWLGVHVTRSMARRGNRARAEALGRRVIEAKPETRFYLARVVAEDGNRPTATALLESWPTRGAEPPADEIAQYLAAAEAVGDAAALWRKVWAILGEPAWLDAHAALAEALAQRQGFGVIAPIRYRLSWETLRRRPLFGVRLALYEGNPVLARRLLADVTPTALAPAAQREWAALLAQVLGDQRALAVLSDLGRRRALPVDLVPVQAQLAAALGDGPEHARAMGELRRLAQAPAGASRVR